jgi:hypothetical protein
MVATPAPERDLLAGATPSMHPVVLPAAQNPVLVQDRVGQAADTRYSFLVLRLRLGQMETASYPLRPFLKRRPADKAGLFKPKHGQPSEQDREPRNITEPHTR